EMLVFDEMLDVGGAPVVALHCNPLRLRWQRADDQRGARLVDQTALRLVDQSKSCVALDRLLAPLFARLSEHLTKQILLAFGNTSQQQPIAEKIKAKLLGRSVGDVAGVVLGPLRALHRRLNDTDRHSEAFK